MAIALGSAKTHHEASPLPGSKHFLAANWPVREHPLPGHFFEVTAWLA
ncbi:hypothetical protein [Rhizobium sp. Kim5]|nr:hypothetical protein [Rhizobium sp. Kim5]